MTPDQVKEAAALLKTKDLVESMQRKSRDPAATWTLSVEFSSGETSGKMGLSPMEARKFLDAKMEKINDSLTGLGIEP